MNSIHQGIHNDHPVQAEDSAHAIQRETETQLNRREFGRNEDQERKTLRTIWHLCVDDADGFN